jgi:hypothetical protein
LREKGDSLGCVLRVFNSMSENPQSPTPNKEVIAPRQESLAGEFADDAPFAEPNYGEARLWLVARDPHCLFAYWNFRPEEHPSAATQDTDAQFFLRTYREDGAVESTSEVRHGAGNWFLHAGVADSGYFAELGFFSSGIWCFLARSGNTRTPPEIPGDIESALFATIPARVSLGKMRDALADSSRPGESLATAAARVQAHSREHDEWTPEHERLLAEILGAEMTGAAPSASSLTLAQRIRHKLTAAADAAVSMPPIPAPQPENAPSSAGASWPSIPGAAPRR